MCIHASRHVHCVKCMNGQAGIFHQEYAYPSGCLGHGPGRTGPRAKGFQSHYSQCSGTVWTLVTNLRSSGKLWSCQGDWLLQTSLLQALDRTHCQLSAPIPSMATWLYCQGYIDEWCIQMNGGPLRVAPTPWHPEPSCMAMSSPQSSFILHVPRKRILHLVRKTYMISYY